MKSIGYVRVSTDEQAQEGVSLEAQQSMLQAYAKLRGLELTETIVDEGISGGKDLTSRAGGKRLFELASRGKVGAVIACKLDRLFRDAADCLNTTKLWDKKNVALHLLDVGGQTIDTSSTMGRFFLTMMAGVAEMERNMIRDRTKVAMSHKRSKGERVSRFAPFGYRFDGSSTIIEPVEQELISEMRSWREGGKSYQAICDLLAIRGVVTKNGTNLWKPMTVRRILLRS